MDEITRDLIIEQQKLKGKLGTYRGQWWNDYMSRRFLFRRNPKFSVPYHLFNRNYFFWDDPGNPDPAEVIMRAFEHRIDGVSYDNADIKGFVSAGRGKRILNIPNWSELSDDIAVKAVA